MLTVTRQGEGSQSPACFMYGYDGPHTGVFLATAMPYDGIAGIMLPTGLSGRKLIDWPTGKKITKVMRVSGNCDGMTINGVPGTPTNSDPDPEESCTVSGNVTMTFTPMK